MTTFAIDASVGPYAGTATDESGAAEAASNATPRQQPPVFLVGSERSGTTLLRLMLDHHPSLAFQYESEYMVQYVGENGELPDPQTVVGRLSTDRIFLSTGFSSDVSGGYLNMVNDWLDQKRRRDGKPIVGATIHKHYDRLPYLMPKARYIHLLRDGRDVSRSCVAMGWYGNTYAACDHWVEALEEWKKVCERVPAEQRLEVRYEDLITNPIETLSMICEFLELPFSQAIFEYVDQSTYSYPDPKLIYQWISKLSGRELNILEGKIGPQLTSNGYRLSGEPTVLLTAAEQKRMYKRDASGRRKFRIKRFGLKLVALDVLSRRLGLQGLQNRVRLKLNAIEETHLK